MKKSTKHWIESAESDLAIIERIIDAPGLTHQASYHAQQAIEKTFKAIIEEHGMSFIKTHSLETLYAVVNSKLHVEFNTDLLIVLDQLYIDARYPGAMGFLPDGKPSLTESETFYKTAKDIFFSVKKELEKN